MGLPKTFVAETTSLAVKFKWLVWALKETHNIQKAQHSYP